MTDDGAPYTYVTTKAFPSHFGFDTLHNLPDMEALQNAGLLSKGKQTRRGSEAPFRRDFGDHGTAPRNQ